MGQNFGQDALMATKGALTGGAQGLQNYGQTAQKPLNMQPFQQGLQQYRSGLKRQPGTLPTGGGTNYPSYPPNFRMGGGGVDV
jgi:hypothetical protein